jgi:ABC-2 type transport system ATP-binding protein
MIEVTNLQKSYGNLEALKGLSFKVPRGQIVGFLGPNGAGKSTTMKILTCYMPPSSGAVSIDGHDAFEAPIEVKKRIGYLPESTPLYSDMTVYDYLVYVAAMRDIPAQEQDARVRDISTTCGANDFLGQDIGTLSKGQRQRVGLAQALIHDPPILILDEPTSGLDPNQIREIRSLIKKLGQDRTIILSTHNLTEVMLTCDRLIIIHQGAIVADGTPEELEKQEARNPTIILEVGGESLDATAVSAAVDALPSVNSSANRSNAQGRVSLSIEGRDGADIRPDLHALAVAEGWSVYELRRDALDLEGIFRQLTRQA